MNDEARECKKRGRTPEDLTNRRFGQLLVLDYDHSTNGSSYWRCLCDCGREHVASRHSLMSGHTTSCGCKKRGPEPEDLSGRRFGRLLVLDYDHTDRNNNTFWRCLCDCGNEHIAGRKGLMSGDTLSCGCYHREISTKHGMSSSPLYTVWASIKQRCNNPANQEYKNYGARGIFICDEWDVFKNFKDWALNNGYAEGLSIDRIDNDDGYYPENCRWADNITQGNNRRTCHYVTYGGETRTISEWARLFGLAYKTLWYRVRNNDMRDFEDYFMECAIDD